MAAPSRPDDRLDDPLWEGLEPELKTALKNELFKQSTQTEQHFESYFSYYEEECQHQFLGLPTVELPIRTHRELIETIRLLYENRDKGRHEIRSTLDQLNYFGETDDIAKNYAIAFCIRVWLMINAREKLDLQFVTGTTQANWEDDGTTLDSFLNYTLYPRPEWHNASSSAEDILDEFCAHSLQNAGGLRVKLVFTDNLADHLKYDRRAHELNIFHHVSFLHAQREGQFTKVLKPEFLEETLWTLNLLFPSGNGGHHAKILPEDRAILELYGQPREISKYSYYGARLEQVNGALRDSIELATAKGLFRRQIHRELPLRPQLTNHNQTISHNAASGTMFHVSGPPRPLVLSRVTRSWSPPFSWGYFSRLRRHTRLQASTDMEYLRFGYILVAIFDHHHTAKELRIDFKREDISEQELFTQIRYSYKKLYGWRRFFSLKSLSSFNIYCVR